MRSPQQELFGFAPGDEVRSSEVIGGRTTRLPHAHATGPAQSTLVASPFFSSREERSRAQTGSPLNESSTSMTSTD